MDYRIIFVIVLAINQPKIENKTNVDFLDTTILEQQVIKHQ